MPASKPTARRNSKKAIETAPAEQQILAGMEAKENVGLKEMGDIPQVTNLVTAPPSELSIQPKRRGRPAGKGNSTKKATAPAPKPEPQVTPIQSHDRLQTVLNYLLKDSENLDLIYGIVIRLR